MYRDIRGKSFFIQINQIFCLIRTFCIEQYLNTKRRWEINVFLFCGERGIAIFCVYLSKNGLFQFFKPNVPRFCHDLRFWLIEPLLNSFYAFCGEQGTRTLYSNPSNDKPFQVSYIACATNLPFVTSLTYLNCNYLQS